MRLRLVTDGCATHALVNDAGEVVERVSEVSLTFGARGRATARVQLMELEVELVNRHDVPKLRRQSGDS